VRIVTDSAADLDPAVAGDLGISIVPMTVHFGRETYSHAEIPIDEFWRRVDEGQAPGTSQPAVGLFEDVFAELVEAGHQVVCLTITGHHSGTYATAQSAARLFSGRVHVFDSMSLSLGEGFQVMAAAEAALQGLGIEHIVQRAKAVRARTRLLILLDTIEHIRRGGRADHLVPVLDRVTKLLNIKPILGIVEGRLRVDGIARSYLKGKEQIQQKIAEAGEVERLAVVHARCPDEACQVAQALAAVTSVPVTDIIVTETGPVLSVHAGPRVIGVAAAYEEPGKRPR
jgi:DegV family protein with EDD domain